MPATQTDRLDGLTTSVAVKAPVKAVATGNIPFVAGIAPYGYMTIDGVACTDNIGVPDCPPDRVLLIGQTDQRQNGIWLVSSLYWSRTLDFDGARDAVNGTLVYSLAAANGGGNTQGDILWKCVAANPVIFGTSLINFEIFLIGDELGLTWEFSYISKANGAGSVVATGVYDDIAYVPFPCTIVGYAIRADQAGDVSIDIWKNAFTAGTPPTVANTICGGVYPGLTGAEAVEANVPAQWNKVINQGDSLRFNIRSAATITRFSLQLLLQRTVTFR